MMEMVGLEDDMPLENKMVSHLIEQAQTHVEGTTSTPVNT